jgi:hypothetical protein
VTATNTSDNESTQATATSVTPAISSVASCRPRSVT